MKNVLLVCHANTCRSVMAHVLLEQMLEERQAGARVTVRSGGIAEFVEAPATGLDGHAYFARAMDDWSPRVSTFLKRIGALAAPQTVAPRDLQHALYGDHPLGRLSTPPSKSTKRLA